MATEFPLVEISARQAFDGGLTRYFTGRACKFGHVCERMVRNGACVECLRAQRTRYRAKHPEKRAEIASRFRASHLGEVREKDRDSKRRLRAANPESEKKRVAAWAARKEARLLKEAGRPRAIACEVCGDSGKTVFDHCHVSGRFRGWLCDRCNRTLGQVKDSPELLRRMADYLESQNGEADLKAA